MRMLVLGGSVFLSRSVAQSALLRGHEVVCACRGRSGAVPKGAQHVVLDRTESGWAGLDDGDWDAVVDVARHPSRVRAAVAALSGRARHWTFVSTINVYADEAVPGGSPATLELREPIDDLDSTEAEDYGAMKVACEQAAQARGGATLVVRPGLIVGPGDPSGRFSYWPSRLADGGEVLAPGDPADAVQVIDVRDLADWIVHCAEEGVTGAFDGTGDRRTRGEVLAAVARGVGTEPALTWVPEEFLVAHDVRPWAGERSLPLWLLLPSYAGLLDHDVTASMATGLAVRRIEETARDTLAWLRENPNASTTGLSRDEEAEVLVAWHSMG